MRKKVFFYALHLLNVAVLLISCSDKNEYIDDVPYTVSGIKILHFGTPKQFIGSNAFHSFGAGSNDMNAWNIDIVREFVGNVNENPISGTPIQDSNGSYLHSLQSIVNSNRENNKVTILCAFGWNGTSETLFSGKRPTQVYWWNDFKTKLQQWAQHFKNQPDVWIEVWNEPYRYDRTDGYTDEIWYSDMNELVSIIRNENNTNIIVVPCAEQGQDESVLVNKGNSFLQTRPNILFDIHGYEKWLLTNDSDIENRLQLLQTKNLPFFFGEIAPLNAGILMNPEPLLSKLHSRGISICAWVWKYDENDTDALLTSSGLPNNNSNNNWGSTYKEYCVKPRNP